MIWITAVICLFFVGATPAVGAEFSVKGEIGYHHYSDRYTREFEFYVKGDAWQAVIERKLPDYVVPGLKTLPNGKVISPPVPRGRKPGDKIYENQSQLTVMGGESVAEHYHFEKHQKYFLGSPVVSRPDLPPYPPKLPGWETVQLMSLFPGPVPTESQEKVMPYLWLAFGSRPYFESLKTNMLVPFYNDWAGRWGRKDFRQEATWRLADTVPRLPLEVIYRDPGARWQRTVENNVVTTNEVLVPWEPPYDQGFMNGRYRVTAQTNIGDLTLPLAFQFEEFVPAGKGDVRAVRTVSGKVHTLYSYCPKKTLRFDFPADVLVRDERVRTDPNQRTFPIYKASRVMTTNEAAALVAPKPRVPATRGPPPPRPWWQRVLAVVALGVPLGVVWWRFYRRGAGASAPPAK